MYFKKRHLKPIAFFYCKRSRGAGSNLGQEGGGGGGAASRKRAPYFTLAKQAEMPTTLKNSFSLLNQ